MAVTPEDVRAIAPELDSVPTDLIERFIAMAERRVNRKAWGARADDGVTCLAAHLLTMRKRGASGQTGPLASVSVGDVSQSFAVQASTDGKNYNATSYGQEFATLQSLVFADRVI